MKKNNYKNFWQIKNISIIISVLMFFVLDRYLKFLAKNLDTDISLIKNILSFTFHPNKGISFSLAFPSPYLKLIIIILLIVLIIYCCYLFIKKEYSEFLAFFSIILGALSNLIDRFKYSYVIDYLNFFNLNILNLADVMISMACLYIIFFKIFPRSKKTNSGSLKN